MKATEFLKKQHREVFALFEQATGSDDAVERRRLLKQIADDLRIHTTIEEEILYPAVRELGTQKAEEMILEAVEEHHVVDLVLAELPEVDPAAETFEAKLTVLRELVKHHVEEEHDELFPMAEKRLGAGSMAELGERLEKRTEELGGRARAKRARA